MFVLLVRFCFPLFAFFFFFFLSCVASVYRITVLIYSVSSVAFAVGSLRKLIVRNRKCWMPDGEGESEGKGGGGGESWRERGGVECVCVCVCA